MTTANAISPLADVAELNPEAADTQAAPTLWRMVWRSRRVMIGGGLLAFIVLLCIGTLPWTKSTRSSGAAGATGIARYLRQDESMVRQPPKLWPAEAWFGYDRLGRSLLARSLYGGTISLAVGAAAATISVVLGLVVGLLAGYRGGWVDAVLMRSVDVMYGLPYVLLVILFKIAFEQPLIEGVRWTTMAWLTFLVAGVCALEYVAARLHGSDRLLIRVGSLVVIVVSCMGLTRWRGGPATWVLFRFSAESANLVVLFSAIGLVSWLTMARVVRGQVLSLRGQPFIEACRAIGLREGRIFARHILPNLIGPITVYATLTVPSAILQESFLSFLGVGVNPPLATWGSLASEGVEQLSPLKFYWWLLLFPCTLLAVTLLSLNFLGDGLRDVFDPKKEAAKI